MMTQQEIENELKSLRESEEARKKNFRSIRNAALVSSITFVLCGLGLVVYSAAYPKGWQEAMLMAPAQQF
jgi:hypothetical protein